MKLLTINEKQFKKDCKIINLNYEYPGYTGHEKWGIITELTEAEITCKYPQQLKKHSPYIILSASYGHVIESYVRNENKYHMRIVRKHINFDYSELVEEHHPEIASNTLENEFQKKEESLLLYKSLSTLSPLQRKRIIKHFYEGISLNQIAIEEDKSYSTIYESYESAIKKLRNILKTPDNFSLLSGN